MKHLLPHTLACLLLAVSTLCTHAQKSPSQNLVVDDSTGLSVPPGFEVDLVYKVDKKKYGSWISMTFDKQGRLVVSDQYKAGTFLIDLPQVGKTLTESGLKSFLSIVDSGECSLLLIICTWYLKVKWFAFPF